MPFTAITQFCTQHELLPRGSHILLGLSGGPDSLFLLHYLAALQREGTITVSAAHLDHEWRVDSAKDAQFCLETAQACGIACYAGKASQIATEKKYNGSREEFARHLRRCFFEQTADAIQADRIALAHHRQDQQETFFIRLLRGATVTGLTGMRPHMGPYIRPLLETDRAHIIDYLERHNITYLTDPTNASDHYLRNRIRHQVIPALRLADPRFDTTFAKTVSHLHETETFLAELTQNMVDSVIQYSCNTFVLNGAELKKAHPVLQKRVIMSWLCMMHVPFSPSNALLEEIIRFMHTHGSKEHQLATTWTLVKNKELLWIRPFANGPHPLQKEPPLSD